MQVNEWLYPGCQCYAVGSRVTCDPPPTDTDQDYLVYDRFFNQVNKLSSLGFVRDGDEAYDRLERGPSQFKSFRKGNINVIVTNNKEFFDKFILATRVAKKLNLTNKEDRITLFTAIKHGECDEELEGVLV